MKRFLHFLFPACIAAVVIYSLLTVLAPTPAPVSPETWQAIEKAMEKERRNGDLVIVHPAWEDGALSHFREHTIFLGKPNTPKYKSYLRIWVVLTHDSPTPTYLTDFIPVFDEKIQDARLLRFEHPDAANVLFDFYSEIRNAKVSLKKGNNVQPCNDFQSTRWICPVRDWNYVGQRQMHVEGELDACLWMHPLKGFVTIARFEDVPLGGRLNGSYALSDDAAKLANGAPVSFRLRIGDEVVGDYRTQQKSGWRYFDIDTGKFLGKTADVSFEVEAPNDGMRHFCFRAKIRKDKPNQEL